MFRRFLHGGFKRFPTNRMHLCNYEETSRLSFSRKVWLNVGVLAGAGGLYYWSHLETVPISGRQRFININDEQERKMSGMALQQVLNEFGHLILPQNHTYTRAVKSIVERIAKAMGDEIEACGDWKVYVIESPIPNAFVLPGGEIFVFTGILPIAQNEDGLAAVLSHEMAHSIARHSAEKLSLYQFLFLSAIILQLFIGSIPMSDWFVNLLLMLPFSRKCEEEADYIGLLMMAKACYDPQEAKSLWMRMERLGKKQPNLAIISTHPTHKDRIRNIDSWMTEAMRRYESAGCNEIKFPFW